MIGGEIMSKETMIVALEGRVRQLEKEVALYREMLDKTIHGVYVIDPDGNIVWINKVSELIDGVKLDEIVGKKDSEVWLDKENNIDISASTIFRTMRTQKASGEQLFSFTDRTGKDVPMFIEAYPFFYEGNFEYVYSIGYYVDYSEKRLNKIAEYRQKFIDENVKSTNETRYTLYDIIGSSVNTLNTIYMAQKIAAKDSPVMIYGETGTGKELYAQGIHNASNYNRGKFVAINCAAIPDNLIESFLFGTVKGAYTGAETRVGLLEEAKGGTLFLDELNSLPLAVQGKLLRVLQEKKATRIGGSKPYAIHCRIISATNQEPRKLVKDKILRADLYYRLAVVVFEIPPLRERYEDMMDLVNHFIKKYNHTYQTVVECLQEDVYNIFRAYSWPGNVRELEHVIEYMMNFVTMSQKELTVQELPDYLKPHTAGYQLKLDRVMEKSNTLNQIMDSVRKDVLERTLRKNGWNITKSAKALGISRENLYHFIKRHELHRPE